MKKNILHLVALTSLIAISSCTSIDTYIPAMKAEAMNFRIHDFVAKDLKGWDQVKCRLGSKGDFEYVWVPRGQSNSRWEENFEISSIYIHPFELVNYTAIESREVFWSGIDQSVEKRVISESDVETIFEVVFPADSECDQMTYTLNKMVHDLDSVNRVTYAKRVCNLEEVDREGWIELIQNLDIALSRPSPKLLEMKKGEE